MLVLTVHYILNYFFSYSYDSRLFNQSSGLDSGFGADDEYSAYSKPLFDRTEASTIYRPKRDDADVYGDVDTQVSLLTKIYIYPSLISFLSIDCEANRHLAVQSRPWIQRS